MGALRYPQRRSKKRGSNPYAERGLDKFALVSAELEAKRERLIAQLGTSLSFVRFVIASDHHSWIPVIVCPTLSKAEIRTLKRMATRLITEDRPAISSANAHQIRSPGVSNSGSNMHASNLTGYEIKAHDAISTHDQPASISVAHAEATQTCQIGTLSYLLAASQRFLWMTAFTFSIAADILSSVLLSKWHADVVQQKGISPSTRRPKEESDSPSATMASSMHFSSLPPIRTPTAMPMKDIKVITPSHSAAHTKAPKTDNRCKSQGQVKKSFNASVSLPMTNRMRDGAPGSGIAKDCKFVKSVSLPKTSHSQESNSQEMLKSPTLMAKKTMLKRGRMERSDNLGQALTGAGLALGLGGLVMGYIPAIICVVCWWYALPNLRKAVGDKPYVKSHIFKNNSQQDCTSP